MYHKRGVFFPCYQQMNFTGMLLCGGEQDDLYIYDLYSSQPNKLYQKLILSEEEGIAFDDRV